MKIIFLDLDGVLNSENFFSKRRNNFFLPQEGDSQINPSAVELLNELLDRTNAKLVLSSTWRLGRNGLEKTKIALRAAGFQFNHRFIGVTPNLVYADIETEATRGDEIQAWLTGREVEAFVILDDNADMAHLLPYLIQTSSKTGLTARDCEAAEKLLEGK